MALGQGEAQTEVFTLIQSDPSNKTLITIAQEAAPSECCFGLPAFAETVFTSEFNNDQHDVLTYWNQEFTGAVITLQRFEGNVFVDVVDITDNTLGTFDAFGFFTTIFQENAIGFLVDWALVLAAEGKGRYRFKTTGTTFTSTTVDELSLDFCLEEYNTFKAKTTVRIDWFLNSIIGDQDDDTKKKDYVTLNRFNQIRLPDSMFGNDKSDFETEYLQLDTGVQIWLSNKQVESYLLRTGLLPNEVHKLISVNILHADSIFITDYNTVNPTKHTNKSVIHIGGYEPEWVNGVLKARVTVEFEQATQNRENKRC